MKLFAHYQFVWILLLIGIGSIQQGFAQKKNKKSKFDSLVTISTEFGDIKLLLYEETPKHRSNFLKLAKEGFYKDLLFHRVIKDFMIQGGDPESRNASPEQALGSGGLDYRVDAEFRPEFIHKKGAIAAARNNNPQKASSSTQFYLVQGKTQTDAELDQMEKRTGVEYTDEQREIYKTIGGTPFLDQNYTVYGEVIDGLEVIDKIAEVETGRADRPKDDVKMDITVERIKKKKITKKYGYSYE